MKIKVDLKLANGGFAKGTIEMPDEPLVALLAAILGTTIPSNDEKEDVRIARKYLEEAGVEKLLWRRGSA